MPAPEPLFGFDRNTLRERVAAWGMPAFRADQILKWVYQRGITDPQAMTDLSKTDRSALVRELSFATLEIVREQQASDDTRKLLLALTDAGTPAPTTECVMIPAENASGGVRRTACVSSQVGCPVGCRFCASGLGGLERNLTTAQIVEQVWRLGRLCPKPDGTGGITNVVFMGMGEPLSNFSAVTAAIRTLNAPWGLNISARRITVSTVGVPAQIRRLADQIDLPITLAISLHAPDDTLRRSLIPWAEGTSVEAIIEAARYYFQTTGREITLEYILLGGVNDGPTEAHALARIASTLRCNVNLIRYNEVPSLPYQRPKDDRVLTFQRILRDADVNTHIRASRGRDISAACGQLRHENKTA